MEVDNKSFILSMACDRLQVADNSPQSRSFKRASVRVLRIEILSTARRKVFMMETLL